MSTEVVIILIYIVGYVISFYLLAQISWTDGCMVIFWAAIWPIMMPVIGLGELSDILVKRIRRG